MEIDTDFSSGGYSTVALATASADRCAILWGASGRVLRRLLGHTDRLARLAFHPMGAHLVGWEAIKLERDGVWLVLYSTWSSNLLVLIWYGE